MLGKMPGYPKDKYANLRCGYAFMFGHSGKKLLFMGQEFAQEREWSEKRELDWFLLQNKENAGMEEFMKELLKIYNKYPAFWTVDDGWDGFELLNADDADRSVYSFYRKDYTGKKRVLFVINFSPMWWKDYWVPFPEKCKVRLILNSDDTRFGGDGNKIPGIITPTAGDCIGRPYHLVFDLPPYTAAVFTF
jgi:1,4-alpha-glucan branching enzyme